MSHIQDLWTGRNGERKARYGKGNRYRAVWQGPDGAEASRTFPDGQKGVAERFLKVIDGDLLRGAYVDPRAGQATVGKVAADWLAGRRMALASREAAERRIRLYLLPQLGGRPVARVTAAAVEDWLAGLDVAPSTAKLLLGLLSSIMSRAVKDGLIAASPLKQVKGPKIPERLLVPWTFDQVAEVRAGMPERWQAMIDCGAGLGLRIGEVLGLAAEDIDFLRRVVHIHRQVQRVGGRLVYCMPKGDKERHVPLPGNVAVELSEHIRLHPPQAVSLPWLAPHAKAPGKPVTAGLLFTMRSGKPVERNSWSTTAWRPALRTAGIQPGRDAGFHQLRHHFASRLLADGVDIRTLASALGHHDPAFTLRVYAHLMPDAADRIRAAIDRGPSFSGRTMTAQQAGAPS